MLARYQIKRGVPATALPEGVRQDTRKHTRHVLRPTEEMVETYLAAPSESSWKRFAKDYRRLLAQRFAEDRGRFDAIAQLACETDVYLGCACPTKRNPNVEHCHTVLALEFFARHYPDLDVQSPS